MGWSRRRKIEATAADLGRGLEESVALPQLTVGGREESLFASLDPLLDGSRPGEAAGQVWVIDDDIAVQVLLKSIFGREGYAVVVSGTVADALEALPAGAHSSLVVLDFNIPGGSGLEVLRELRSRSAAPVVMVSNIRRPELVAQAFGLGADDFVEKPFDPRSLLVRARRLMS